MSTLRLIFPEWQGGMNPNYAFGPHILAMLAPESPSCESMEVPIDYSDTCLRAKENGYYAGSVLKKQLYAATKILEEKKPKKVITFGGDCSVSQASFDYLHGIYPENTGILWLDAHPDISTPDDCDHEHAMVLGNLIGGGAPDLCAMVRHPFSEEDIIYAGLIADEMLPFEKSYVNAKKMVCFTPEQLVSDSNKLLDMLCEKEIKNLLVHLDLDVLSPDTFRSLLCNEPGIAPVDYAVGKLSLTQIVRILQDVNSVTEIVGFTIAEYMPWDLINLKKAMESISIFN